MRAKKPDGKGGSKDNYFMSQEIMRKARWEGAVLLSMAKRKKNSHGAYVSFPYTCGCGCGPIGTVRYER